MKIGDKVVVTADIPLDGAPNSPTLVKAGTHGQIVSDDGSGGEWWLVELIPQTSEWVKPGLTWVVVYTGQMRTE